MALNAVNTPTHLWPPMTDGEWDKLEALIFAGKPFQVGQDVVLRMASLVSRLRRAELSTMLGKIRAAGWAVAVHNDYPQNGVLNTFWLFTNNKGRFIKGEAQTDREALQQCLDQI